MKIIGQFRLSSKITHQPSKRDFWFSEWTAFMSDTTNFSSATKDVVRSIEFYDYNGRELMATGQQDYNSGSSGSYGCINIYENVNNTWVLRIQVKAGDFSALSYAWGLKVRLATSNSGKLMLYFSRPTFPVSGNGSVGIVHSALIDTTNDANWTATLAGFRKAYNTSKYQYMGKSFTVHNGFMLVGAPGYQYSGVSSNDRFGMIQFVRLYDGTGPIDPNYVHIEGVHETLTWDGVSNILYNHRTNAYITAGNNNFHYGSQLDQDGNTVVITAPGQRNTVPGYLGYISVVNVDTENKEITTLQYIDNPAAKQGFTPESSFLSVVIKDGSIFATLGYDTNFNAGQSLIEYRRSAGEWRVYGWWDLPTDIPIMYITARSRDELIVGFEAGEQQLYSIKRSPE